MNSNHMLCCVTSLHSLRFHLGLLLLRQAPVFCLELKHCSFKLFVLLLDSLSIALASHAEHQYTFVHVWKSVRTYS